MSWGDFTDTDRYPDVLLIINLDGTGALHLRGVEIAECRCWPYTGYPPKPEIGQVVYDPLHDAATVYASMDGRAPDWHRLVGIAHECGVTRDVDGLTEVYTRDATWVRARKVGHFWEPIEDQGETNS